MLNEDKRLDVYKELISLLGDYIDKFPATPAEKIFNDAIVGGLNILPKDKRAIKILSLVLSKEASVPAKVQELLNIRFADTDFGSRPVYVAEDDKRYVAFWDKDGRICDKVLDLINVEKKTGHWCDAEGNKVKLLNL